MGLSDDRGLRTLYNEVNSTIRTLTALKIEASQYGLMIKSILLTSIPTKIRIDFYKIAEKNNDRTGNIEVLLNFIKSEIEAIEKANLSEKEIKDQKIERKGTATSLVTNCEGQSQRQTMFCVFCKNNSHSTKLCKNKLTVTERKEILKKEGRCYRCANRNHTSKFCKAQWVKCEECNGRHLTSLCEKHSEKSKQSDNVKEHQERLSMQRQTAALNTLQVEETAIFLQTAKAILTNLNNSKEILSRIIMDNGSQRTFVTQTLKNELCLKKSGDRSIQIIAFGDKAKRNSKIYETVELQVKNQYNDKIISINAVVVPKICEDILPCVEQLTFNENLELADIKKSEVRIINGINLLIGQDNYWKFNTEHCQTIANNLVAVKTFFGWTIQGCKDVNKQLSCVLNINEQIEETFNVAQFWDLEAIGINNCSKHLENEIIKLNINWINDRYEVNLPWKNNNSNLNENRLVALKRLRTLTIKLLNKDLIEEYDAQIKELLANDFAEKVQDTNETQPNDRVYYMPHMAVYRNDKSTSRVRIVFDASSSEPGLLSLNDHLAPGEDMVANLLTTLLRFRSNLYAITSDIKKAFLQISVDPKDRDVQRFWWYDSIPKANEPIPIPTSYRMKRVTFGVTSSPYMLTSTIRQHLENCKNNYGDICEKLKTAFYVDDLIVSEESEEKAKIMVEESYKIMKDGKFELTKWNSNQPQILKYLPREIISNDRIQKVLGINWCTITDEISVDVNSSIDYIKALRATKRNVLKSMAKIYDPIGIIGPFTVRIKILLQNVWNAGVDWDESLPKNLMDEFVAWQDEIPILNNFTIPRCLVNTQNSVNELHIFADASPAAYGAVAYIRTKNPEGVLQTNLICSKNRIRPIKRGKNDGELTLPKLELTAALIAARLKSYLISSLQITFSTINLWSDSSIALDWIRGRGKNLQTYVKARVQDINSQTNVYDWKHCNGKSNPADLLTRGIKAKVLHKSQLWKHGPSWLNDSEASEILFTNVTQDAAKTGDDTLAILNIEDYSKIKRLMRVTAWIFRFINILTKNQSDNQREELTFSELQKAEAYWIKQTQIIKFKDEIDSLEKNGSVLPNSKIYSLNPILTEGIIRLKSRLHNDNPIILPKGQFSKLLIQEAHATTLHGGVNMVLTQIRKRFWLIKGRQMIKSELKKCVVCKRLWGKPGGEPWTSIPLSRVETTRPFETTGIDFAGPLYIMEDKGENQRKVYILLFTCAAVRAVHLELLLDMTTKSCIDAFRRFFARFGTPATILSDNAKTFKRTDLELRKLEAITKSSDMQSFATHKGITWKYIPERAAWWGGFWERLVKTVKSSLKAAVGKARLTFDELNTTLAEIEGVTNSRPLTYISNDHNDLEPLTPAHFLLNAKLLLPAEFKSDGSELAKSWEAKQTLTKKYLKRWKTEYLNQLRSLHQCKNNKTRSVKEGDVVLVHEDSKPRLLWKLGLVKTTYPGRDGRVRVCDVKMSKGNILKRPVQLLYPLEISSPGAGCQK